MVGTTLTTGLAQSLISSRVKMVSWIVDGVMREFSPFSLFLSDISAMDGKIKQLKNGWLKSSDAILGCKVHRIF
jgi:hypothetical protein